METSVSKEKVCHSLYEIFEEVLNSPVPCRNVRRNVRLVHRVYAIECVGEEALEL